MKNKILLCLVLLITQKAMAQTTYPSGVNGCIARWTFDSVDVQTLSSLTDYSGNNNHGSVTDIASTNGFRNLVHKAGRFNGMSSFAQVTPLNNNQFCSSNLSVIALIKFNDFYSQLCQGNNIIYHGINYNNGGANWSFFVSDMSDCNTYSPQNESLKFQGTNQQQSPFNSNNHFVDTNQWYFLAVSHTNQSTTYYVEAMNPNLYNNNIQVKYSVNEYNPIGNSAYDLYIGKTINPPYPYYINADIDELIVFNRELSQTDMQSVYQYLWGYVNAVNAINNVNDIHITANNHSLYLNDPEKKIQHIELFNSTGARLLNSQASNEIPLHSALSNGLYFIRMQGSNGETYFQKIVL
ncbi:MAG: LamG-like jellyroll fold domain-containing protein [Chitinophagaceae bacterium]